MKIAVVNNLYFPFNHGGAEQVVKKMINELQGLQNEVFLITTRPHGSSTTSLSESPKTSDTTSPLDISKTQENKLKIYYLNSSFYNLNTIPLGLRFFWHLNNIFDVKKYFKIKKILQNTRPDLIITHNLMGLGFLVPLIIRQLKIRHEHILHDIQLLYPSGLMLLDQEKKVDGIGAKIYQFLTRSLFVSPAKIISPSSWLLNEHLKRNFFPKSLYEIKPFDFKAEKISTTPLEQQHLPETSATSAITPVDSAATPTRSAKTLLFVGQIEDHKGIIWLISVFKKLKDPDLKLIIVGDGTKMLSAQKLAMNDQRIKLLGRLKPEEIKKIMTASDYLIVPSLCYENSPTVIYEAQALNLPVIAAAIGGIPEIIKPQDYLFIAGNEIDFIKCLKQVEIN